MKRGEIYRTQEKTPERGYKPGFYVVVSRNFVAGNDDISTVVCAPVYSEIMGLRSEVIIGADDGLPHESSIRCDFLTLMFKRKLTHFVGALPTGKMKELNRALRYALELGD
ncbi:MAG: type II toxin-antitoxin system PemK/MazF family toxin [Blastocatellales bacterium]